MLKRGFRGLSSIIFSVLVLCGVMLLCTYFRSDKSVFKDDGISISDNPDTKKGCQDGNENKGIEMRAVWIPFMTLDMKSDFNEDAFKDKFRAIVKEASDYRINTLVVHIRSHSDAMYPSKIYPWSHLLSGIQGKDPLFDPLEFMIEETHKADMEFHAWINPLRVRVNGVPRKLSDTNPYVIWENDDNILHKRYTIKYKENIYYNPAYKEVRNMIVEGIKEIVDKYNVDAIHFDDYFYPEDIDSEDSLEYRQYIDSYKGGEGLLNLEDWRKENINLLISETYRAIKEKNKNVRFGISPSGNINNDNRMGADVYKWGRTQGYVDYLCPQIYTNSENPVLPFEETAREWRELVSCKDIKLYYGLGLYKAGSEADKGTWKKSDDIIMNQIEYCRRIGCDGFMLYSWEYMKSTNTNKEIENVMKVWN